MELVTAIVGSPKQLSTIAATCGNGFSVYFSNWWADVICESQATLKSEFLYLTKFVSVAEPQAGLKEVPAQSGTEKYKQH
jgi:hypothetical protein